MDCGELQPVYARKASACADIDGACTCLPLLVDRVFPVSIDFCPWHRLRGQVADQLPGLIVVTDMSDVLNYGYFPSYNLAVSPVVRSIAGVDAMEAKWGAYFGYHSSPR